MYQQFAKKQCVSSEKKVVCKAPNLKLALFINSCCYYCFNLEFSSDAKGIYYFFQDFVSDRSKKNATYLIYQRKILLI